jgi:hypothetical protein
MSQAQALFERRRPIYQLATFHIPVLGHEELDDLIQSVLSVYTEKRGSEI